MPRKRKPGEGPGEWIDGPEPGMRLWKALPDRPRKGRPGRAPSATPPTRRTPAEIAEVQAYKRSALEIRAREVAALEALSGPALHVEGERQVEHERAVTLDARTMAGRELVNLGRYNGSSLRAFARTYDGMRGQRPKFYALLTTYFRSTGGRFFRSKGVSVEGPELRAVGEALLTLAGEFDAARTEGIEPWARPEASWKAPPVVADADGVVEEFG